MTHRQPQPSSFSPFQRLGARPRMLLLALAAALTLSACERRDAAAEVDAAAARPSGNYAAGGAMESRRMRMAEPAPPAPAAMSLDQQAEKQAGESAPLQRYLAIRQDLNVEVAPDQLAESWGKVRDLCGTLRCELLSSSLLRETPQQAGNAMLEMRVEPADVEKLLAGLAGVAKVVAHNTTSEDKTAEVIDVEARIKNRTEFRDSLRVMLRDTTTKRTMADLLQIQRTLADTQAELDASATQRKVLQQQTSKQHIQIQFTTVRALVGGGESYNPMTQALRNAGRVLAESVGSLITFVAAVLPWLLLLVPVLWGVRRLWLRRRQARAA